MYVRSFVNGPVVAYTLNLADDQDGQARGKVASAVGPQSQAPSGRARLPHSRAPPTDATLVTGPVFCTPKPGSSARPQLDPGDTEVSGSAGYSAGV